MECPVCGSARVVDSNGRYKCKSCGKEFDDSSSQERMSSATSAYLRANKLTRTPSFSGTSRERYGENELNPEEIYEIGIKGAALIQCYDLNCSGSGFLARDSGLVITNAHVIFDEDKGDISHDLDVTVNGITCRAEVIAYGDVNGSDVALLQLERKDVKQRTLLCGNSDMVKIGMRVYAIGNSLGQGLCITSGIISDKDREVFNERCFMSDVSINSGNSGGPLLNGKGEVIAICVAGVNNAKGMNYFIPINDVLELLKEYL